MYILLTYDNCFYFRQFKKKKITDFIIKNRNFVYNTDSSINTREITVCRRPVEKSHKVVRDFTCSPKGWYIKNNIKYYFKQCTKISKSRNVQILLNHVL